jgi:hypothetical protein
VLLHYLDSSALERTGHHALSVMKSHDADVHRCVFLTCVLLTSALAGHKLELCLHHRGAVSTSTTASRNAKLFAALSYMVRSRHSVLVVGAASDLCRVQGCAICLVVFNKEVPPSCCPRSLQRI